jgi:hypothetical protein
MDDRVIGVHFPAGVRDFISPTASKQAQRPTESSYPMATEGSFLVDKAAEV